MSDPAALVAAATRMLNAEGLLDYSGHVSVRLPEDGEAAVLLQPFDQPRGEVTPDSLIPLDADGEILPGDNRKPPSERYIHSEIFRARPDVGAIAHFHPDIATVFSLVDDVDLAPVKNHAARWADGIPTHPDPAHINSPELGQSLAATLGNYHAALIRAHGVVVVAESVEACFVDSVHFVENAETYYSAAALGRVSPLTSEEMTDFLDRFDRPRHIAKLWDYYLGRARRSGAVPEGWAL